MSPISQQAATLSRLVITDGTAENTASLLVYACGSHLKDWSPRSPNPAAPIWVSSPYQDGKHLVSKTYDNILDTFTVIFNDGEQDETIKSLRRFIELLEKGTDYWIDEFNTNKFWLEARSPYETNIRYAIVVDYQIPEINNPYDPTFGATEESALDDIQLNIEHTIWTDNLEVGADCVKFSTGRYEDYWGDRIDASPTESADDAYTIDPATYSHAAIMIDIGKPAANSSESGIRFRNVAVPKNATIHNAWITFQAQNNCANDNCHAKIYGELNATPAVFASYADLKGRTRTSTWMTWASIPHWVLDSFYDSVDFADVVQEIVDLAGWASGNNMVIFIVDNASTANAVRYGYSWNGAGDEPVLHIEYSDGGDQIYHGEFTPTCERTPAVTNYWRKKSLTHVFSYNSAGFGSYGPNLVDNNLVAPVDLFPTPPAHDDALYCGISQGSSYTNQQAFNNLVLNIATLGANLTSVVLEYWNGAVWLGPGTIDYEPNKPTDSDPTVTTGVFIIKWALPSDWAIVDVNGIFGLWIRLRVDVVGGGPVTPTQKAGQPIYTIGWNDIKISSDELKGDISGILNFLYAYVAPTSDSKLIISARREDRVNSEKFVSSIPLTSMTSFQPPDASTTLGGGAATLAVNFLTPTGSCTNFTTAGAAGAATSNSIDLGPRTYAGRYRAYLRYKSNAATIAGEMGAYLSVQSLIGNYDTPTVYNTNAVNTAGVLDLGIISLPSDYLYEIDSPLGVTIDIKIIATAAIDVDLYFLDLMPVDDAHLEIEMINNKTGFVHGWDNPFKIITSNLKTGAYCFEISASYTSGLKRTVEWDYAVIAHLKVNILGSFNLEPNTDYRLYFLWFQTAYTGNGLFEGYIIPNMDITKRYLFLRGDE